MPPDPLEGVTVDRIGTDVIVRFPDEDMAEACRHTMEMVIPMMGVLADLLNNGGLFGDL